MLEVEIGKINLAGNRILPNIFCVVSLGTEMQRTKTHYGTSHANVSERLQFSLGQTQWMHLEIRHKHSVDASSSDDMSHTPESTLMCSCDQDISNVKMGTRNLVRLIGKPDYCNSGLVEYVVRRTEARNPRRNILEQQSVRSESSREEPEESEPSQNQQSASENESRNSESRDRSNRSRDEIPSQDDRALFDEQPGSRDRPNRATSNKAAFVRKQFAPQYDTNQAPSHKQIFNSVNSSFTNSYSREERFKFQFQEVKLHNESVITDEEGVRFVNQIEDMLNERNKNEMPQSRESSSNNLNTSKLSEENRKFVPQGSRVNRDLSFGVKGGNVKADATKNEETQARLRQQNAIRKLSIIREGEHDRLADEQIGRQKEHQAEKKGQVVQQNIKKESAVHEGRRSAVNTDSDDSSVKAGKTVHDYHTIENMQPDDVNLDEYGIGPREQRLIDRRALDRLGVYRINPAERKKDYRQRRQKRPWNKRFELNEQRYNTEGDQSVQEGSEGFGTEEPYESGAQPNGINHYLDSSCLSMQNIGANMPISPTKRENKPVNSFQPITHSLLPGNYLLFALSCNVHYLKDKNFRNKMSLDILRDGVKLGRTSLCSQKFPPYEWPEYFQVESFDELKFVLVYHEPELPNQNEREESVHELVKEVIIGTSVLKGKALKDVMSFVLPMEFKGHKMGELSFKLNYQIGSESESSKPKMENIGSPTALKNRADQLLKAVSLPGIILGTEPVSSRPCLPALEPVIQLTPSNRKLIVSGVELLAEAKKKEQLEENSSMNALSPPKLIYPRSKAGFITGRQPILTSTSIAKMYDREPQREPQTIDTAKAPQTLEKKKQPTEEIQQTLNLNTIIFKNFDLTSPVNDTFLVVEFAGCRLETEKIHEKDILWTKQHLSGNFSREDGAIEFSIYEQVEESKMLLGKNKLMIADIRPKHRMYSYKLPIYSHRNEIVGELLLHYEFQRKNQEGGLSNNRSRFLSCSIDNYNSQKQSVQRNYDASSKERSVVERYMERVVDSTYSEQRLPRRRHREPFYYSGKNVKFGLAPRFKTEQPDESVRSLPGPGSYCLPSLFDRHKVIEG